MVGSKRKVYAIMKEFEKEGIPRESLERIHSPMGLDIGAITPEEIAISVLAEMIAVRRQPAAEWRKLSKSVFAEQDDRTLSR
jgi:xanthine dehydrogenase accessory factor